MQLIVFVKEKKYYGIQTENVGEIIKKGKVFPVPQAPIWVEGLINLRGTVVTLVNFATFLAEETNEELENIIVLTKNTDKIGLLVEKIHGVFTVNPEDIQHIKKSEQNQNIEGLISIDGKMTNIINIMTIFSENEGFH
ncbi:chemotaxis protein CheW [Vagococcus silagei]|uniref:Purine-binding chemotaxis protein CheW n=1 Tax=Vagococcus silagei TaxID=2508885 RepID=A0A4S3B6V3_9ENTE|nr:chemotaxis protein CheW [Vagococcus silagei]THB61316.1 purine-binding chemotaxis protein CheW [Vagococcus silagei]